MYLPITEYKKLTLIRNLMLTGFCNRLGKINGLNGTNLYHHG